MEKDFNLVNDDNKKVDDVIQEPMNFNLERRIEMLTERIIETTNFIKENIRYDRE